MGHPDFRVNGRIFATLGPDADRAMVKLTPEHQADMLARHPAMFRPAAGAWGRKGSTLVALPAATVDVIRPVAILAWRLASEAKPARRRKP